MRLAWRYLGRMASGFYIASASHREIGMEFFAGSARDTKAAVGERLAEVVAALGPSQFHVGVAEAYEKRSPQPLALPQGSTRAARLEACYFTDSADGRQQEIVEAHFTLPLADAASVLGDLFERAFTHGGSALRFDLS
jgi:hypothetical protein